MGDFCDLECTEKKKKKKPKKPIEFVGPVKIVIVEEVLLDYYWKVFESGLIALSYMFMGATVITVLAFTLTYSSHWTMNVHILLNTMATQFCIACAYLMNTGNNLPSIPLKKLDKTIQCSFLQIFGHLMFLAANIIMFVVYAPYFKHPNRHAIFGLLNFIFTSLYIPTIPLQIINFKVIKPFIFISDILGILSFFFSSLSFASGVLEPRLMNFLPHHDCPIFLIIFCTFYTTVIVRKYIYNVIIDIIQKIKSLFD